MIIILSQSENEESTNLVIDWLENLCAKYVRINGNDLSNRGNFFFCLDNEDKKLEIKIDDQKIGLDDVTAVWYRRWRINSEINSFDIGDTIQNNQIKKQLNQEQLKCDWAFFSYFKNAYWLNTQQQAKSDDKFLALSLAKELGLLIPPTLITTQKNELLKFFIEHQSIITKTIGNITIFDAPNNHKAIFFTEEINLKMIKESADEFFPSLFQKKIEKEFELRIFFLEGDFYSMAIFSQSNQQTSVDFRRYDWQNPNRWVPYKLNQQTQDQLHKLMKKLRFNMGSIDMIKGKDGNLYFLEINPVGQFGMVSTPCNYYLEEKIAQLLIEKENGKNTTL